MTDIARRRFLQVAASLPLAGLFTRVGALPIGDSTPSGKASAVFRVRPDAPGYRVSESLASFSYETLQLANPEFFSADNKELVQLFRRLNPGGVLRIGGNTSDATVWSGYRGALPGVRPRLQGTRTNSRFVLKPESLRTLAGFLDATGWTLVFGVNLRIGVPRMAVELARAVRDAVGDRLLAIQIGNEPNDFEPDYAAYDIAWKAYARHLRAAGLPLGGPDTGANTDWVLDYAREHGGGSVLLSRHYYRNAAAQGSITDMLGGDPSFCEDARRIVRAGEAHGLPFRLTEANSYYDGGRDGVSNVFAAALWGCDFMLSLAQCGVQGIHFHGGTLQSVEASLGRKAKPTSTGGSPADRRRAASSRYAPIAGDLDTGFQPEPLYHGMQLAQRFAGARFIDGRLATAGANLTAYAAKRDDGLLVALINKDMARDAEMSVHGLSGYRPRDLTRMTAPALTSYDGIRMDERPLAEVRSGDVPGALALTLPKGSAAWLQLERAGA